MGNGGELLVLPRGTSGRRASPPSNSSDAALLPPGTRGSRTGPPPTSSANPPVLPRGTRRYRASPPSTSSDAALLPPGTRGSQTGPPPTSGGPNGCSSSTGGGSHGGSPGSSGSAMLWAVRREQVDLRAKVADVSSLGVFDGDRVLAACAARPTEHCQQSPSGVDHFGVSSGPTIGQGSFERGAACLWISLMVSQSGLSRLPPSEPGGH